MQVDTNEGADGENNELLQWLTQNKLLKAKQQFIEFDISMDDLQSIDLKNDLNEFVKTDLKLSGILASRAKKAIENLQTKSYVAPQQAPPQQVVRIVLGQEEDKAINDINTKHNKVKTYLNILNNNINKLKKVSKENKDKINSIENEIINKIKVRMNELRNKSDEEINKKQQQISSHINNVKIYESSLNDAQIKHNKLLHDDKLDKTKRKIKIMKVNENVGNGNIMNNKSNFNPMVSVEFDKGKVFNFIKHIGSINNHNYPKPPQCFVKDITDSSATIEFRDMQSSLEHSVEINDYGGDDIKDNEDDEKGVNWKELAVFQNKSTYFCGELKDDKAYKVRTRCRNKYGWSPYAKVISFITKKTTRLIDSKIMNKNEKQIFLGLMSSSGTDIGKTFKLIYRGSRDGFTSVGFHNKCDNKGKTVTVIYSHTNNVFGAYRSKPWQKVSSSKYQSDNNAFLFLIRSSKGYQAQIFKVKPSNANAVYDYASNSGYMFGFGRGHDICIYDGCNNSNYSHTYPTGYSYQMPNIQYYLNGTETFKVKEIEIFTSE